MIKENIKSKMSEIDWSVKDLERATGIRYGSLIGYLNGKRNIHTKHLETIFKTLNLKLCRD